jgi:hypothetical protein
MISKVAPQRISSPALSESLNVFELTLSPFFYFDLE